MCWASTSRQAGRGGSPSSSRASMASIAASDSSTSKRLAGAIIARLGSSNLMVGAADTLHQAAHALGRAELDHEVDVAPVDAEIERGGRHHGAQLADRHRRLDLAPLLDGERAVMQANRQVLLVQAPQAVEGKLGLGAGVDEQDRGLVLADDVVDLGQRVATHMAAPGRALVRIDDRDLGRRAGLAVDDLDRLVAHAEVLGQLGRVGDGGREANETGLRRQRCHPSEAKRQMMAALGGRKGMQLVDDDATQACKELLGVGIAQQQRQRLGRGHQEIGRPLALAQATALRRVAGAALGADRQLHLGDRHLEIAADVGGQRLERRDVERMQLALTLGVRQVLARSAALGELDQRGQEARQGLAAAGGRDQQGAPGAGRQPDQRQLVLAGSPAAAFEPA